MLIKDTVMTALKTKSPSSHRTGSALVLFSLHYMFYLLIEVHFVGGSYA